MCESTLYDCKDFVFCFSELEFVRRDVRDDFDFIDNGSSVAHSENNSPMPGRYLNFSSS